MRHEFREKECAIFRKHALIEYQEKFASVWTETLNRMRKASGKVPQIALAHVIDEDRPIGIH
jgi:hypothetical protein